MEVPLLTPHNYTGTVVHTAHARGDPTQLNHCHLAQSLRPPRNPCHNLETITQRATRRTRELHKWKEKCSLLLTDDWNCKYLLPICDNCTADSKNAVLENFLRVWDFCLFPLCCWALYRSLTLYSILVDAIRKISHVMTCSTRSDRVKSVIQAPWTHPSLTLQNVVI